MIKNEDYIWEINRTVLINSHISKVWDIISSEGHLEKFHPFCKKNQIKVWNNDSHADSIVYYNNRILYRNFYNWFEGLINNGRVLASGNRHEIRKLMSNIPIQVKVAPLDKEKLRPLFKRMLDEEWITAGRILEDEGEIILETNKSETFYEILPQILEKEKIIVQKIMSEDDSLDSLYTKLVEGKQWK